MRRRAVQMILTAVTVVALLMGIPGAAMGSIMVWNSEQRTLEARAQSLVRAVDRRVAEGHEVPASLVEAWASPLSSDQEDAWTRVSTADGEPIVVGAEVEGPALTSVVVSALGTTVRMEIPATQALRKVGLVVAAFLGGTVASMVVGWALANRLSRRLSAPLIYLAAQAEQIGSGQVRARVKASGIEEIDLVQDELARTGERMAGRLAAERQFAADASHQLRTPLTALSMRLEEIEMISTQEEVRQEAQRSLEQVERLTGVVSEFLDPSARSGGLTEAIHVVEVFITEREEWEEQFEKAGRELVFTDEAEQPVLADGAKLAQVLATLIENSLRYGAGTTRVVARRSTNKRGVMIDVSDEGPGVEEDLAPDIFEYGVSGHGSTGIGLALARDLMQGMGGRLELTQQRPPVFTASLSAIPTSLDPDRVMPEGPLVSMGRRSRRF
ncbi:ATP-binding protein [Actinomyces polynesiensis]|uniref:ATP-binding protein n=1 Tax=Actinomyces polynesiensis TaxID=1325934 RepID=UPI0005BE5AE9|nr:ATP-binding protein [Actinomyces polynesiensis]